MALATGGRRAGESNREPIDLGKADMLCWLSSLKGRGLKLVHPPTLRSERGSRAKRRASRPTAASLRDNPHPLCTTLTSLPPSCQRSRQDELHSNPRSLDPHSSQDCFSQCHRLITQCCPYAEGCRLLRKAPPWTGSRAPGQGSLGPLPEEVLRQEPVWQAPCSHYWRPYCARLRTKLLLPLASPQE